MGEKIKNILQIKYLMFENKANVCWLNASIALVAHNETFKKVVKCSPESQINKIISSYNEAVTTYNNSDSEEKRMQAKKIMESIQNMALNSLQGSVKFEYGKPDSAFCALLNLIILDKSDIEEHVNISWIWRKQCSSCGVNSKTGTFLKPIITLPKVNSFNPESPSTFYTCTCKSEEEMRLIYKELPPCLIFHFEKVVNAGNNLPVRFRIQQRGYHLTGLIILKKTTNPNVNHYITWIRNPVYNVYLECNDLNIGCASFSQVQPEFDLKEVFLCIFEAFDNSGRIKGEVSTDLENDVENSNIECITLDDDDNAEKADSCCKTEASEISKSTRNDETFKFSKNSNSELNAYKELLLLDDEMGNNPMSHTFEENVRENKVNSYDEVQVKMQHASLKDNNINSGKTRKEGIDNKYEKKIKQSDKANDSGKIKGGGILQNRTDLSDDCKNFMAWVEKYLEMQNEDVSTDLEHNVENSNVELVEFADEDDNARKADSCCKTKVSEISKSTRNDETSKFSRNSNSELLLVDDESGNNPMSDTFEDTSYVRENKVNSYNEVEEKMQHASLKHSKNNSVKTRKEGINSEKSKQSDKANDSGKIESGGILQNRTDLSDNRKDFMAWFGKLLETRMEN